MSRPYWVILVSSLLVVSCAGHSPSSKETAVSSQNSGSNQGSNERPDPLENFNRAMWHFNYRILDPLLLRPVAMVWKHYLPHSVQQIIGNVLSNLDEPSSSVNYLLQANFSQALRRMARFFINTFWGLGGILDIAAMSGLPTGRSHQFGDVMAYYQIGQGPYIMLPGYGPTTPRRLLGQIPDRCYFPLSYLSLWGSIGKFILQSIENRAQLLTEEAILRSSPDDYLTFREAYLQWQAFVAEENQGHQEHVPEPLNHSRELDELD